MCSQPVKFYLILRGFFLSLLFTLTLIYFYSLNNTWANVSSRSLSVANCWLLSGFVSWSSWNTGNTVGELWIVACLADLLLARDIWLWCRHSGVQYLWDGIPKGQCRQFLKHVSDEYFDSPQLRQPSISFRFESIEGITAWAAILPSIYRCCGSVDDEYRVL